MGGSFSFLIIMVIIVVIASLGKVAENEKRKPGAGNNKARPVPTPSPKPITGSTAPASYNQKSAFNQAWDYGNRETANNYNVNSAKKENLSANKESKPEKSSKDKKRLEAEKTLAEYITDIRETAETKETFKKPAVNEERTYGSIFDEFGASDALYLAKKDAETNATWL